MLKLFISATIVGTLAATQYSTMTDMVDKFTTAESTYMQQIVETDEQINELFSRTSSTRKGQQ